MLITAQTSPLSKNGTPYFCIVMSSRLKIGVFGVGHLGKIHVRLILELQDLYELVGFFDPSDSHAESVIAQFKLKRFADPQELIDACDCVSVVTPTLTHFDIAHKAIRSSKHVFIEKPVTETPEQAKSLLHLAHEAGIQVQVGHVERYNPAFVTARPLIQRPMFFEVHRLATYNPRGTDVSVVMDLMIHDLDIVLSLVNSSIRRVSANGIAVVSDTPDMASARIEFDNGCVANLTTSRVSTINMRKMRVFQPSGYLSVDFLHHQVEQISVMQSVPAGIDQVMALTDSKHFVTARPHVENSNAILEELCSFHRSIIEGQEVIVSIDDAYRALDLATRITEKLKTTFVAAGDNK